MDKKKSSSQNKVIWIASEEPSVGWTSSLPTGAQLCSSEVEDNLCFKCLSAPTFDTPAPRGFREAVLL